MNIKFVTIFLIFFISTSVFAADFEKINYKNIKEGEKLTLTSFGWSTKVDKKNKNYYVKRISQGTRFSEFYSPDNEFLFSTGCEYEFIHSDKLYGYSNNDLKFYEFSMQNGILEQRELPPDEILELFPKFEQIKISDFSQSTNSLKIKKGRKPLNIIILNDTDRYFYNYGFSTNNAKYKPYELRGMLKITKRGMIQFSRFGENTKNSPWFILLVR